DIDSTSLTYSLVSTANAHGTVTITNASTGAYSYTPDADYNGPASFTFKANDGALSTDEATSALTSTAVNEAPVAAARPLPPAEALSPYTTLFRSDIDSTSLTYSLVSTANAHGTVTITNASTGAYSYTPDADYNGPASFTFKANDGAL